MPEKALDNFFNEFIERKGIFLEKKALQSSYTPDSIPHREEQISQVANILAPCLRRERPSNLFVYGKTGSGKTLTIKHVVEGLKRVAQSKSIPLETLYLNCKLKKVADTEYRLIAQLARDLGQPIPATGLPTDEVYSFFYKILDSMPRIVLLILDEIDQLAEKTNDQLLYNLTRVNAELKQAQLALVGISNDPKFTSHLDPRVKSSLSEEELVFPPYNALQLQEILHQRASLAFHKCALAEGVIEKCAAYAAREHGDARRALELLRVAGELAERDRQSIIALTHLDAAEEKIDHDSMIDIVASQPLQHQLTLFAVLSLCKQSTDPIFTGEIYESYSTLCTKCGVRPLTQRRISDILGEFDMLGLLQARIISKGRYGRTREIRPSLPVATEIEVRKVLCESLSLPQG